MKKNPTIFRVAPSSCHILYKIFIPIYVKEYMDIYFTFFLRQFCPSLIINRIPFHSKKMSRSGQQIT